MKNFTIAILLLIVVPLELAASIVTFGVYRLFIDETFTEILLDNFKTK